MISTLSYGHGPQLANSSNRSSMPTLPLPSKSGGPPGLVPPVVNVGVVWECATWSEAHSYSYHQPPEPCVGELQDASLGERLERDKRWIFDSNYS